MIDLDFVHHFIPSPAGNSRVLLLLHGTGGNESDLIPLGHELDPGAALLSLRGKILENGMPRFFRRLAEGIFDEEDVVCRANELGDFVIAAAARYSFDTSRVTAVGYSNGANIAAALLLLRPSILEAAILFRAMVPLTDAPRPDLTGKRILISAGDEDSIIPAENVQGLATLLTNAGAAVELKMQHAGHGLIADDLAIARDFLR